MLSIESIFNYKLQLLRDQPEDGLVIRPKYVAELQPI
jgi:hypothetical protein